MSSQTRVLIDGKPVELPETVPGAQILDTPGVREKVRQGRTVFLVNPDTREMEIVDPEKSYQPAEGTVVDSTAPSISG